MKLRLRAEALADKSATLKRLRNFIFVVSVRVELVMSERKFKQRGRDAVVSLDAHRWR